jgi:hypothetical protein
MEIAISRRIPLQWQPKRSINKNLFLIPLIFIIPTNSCMPQNKINSLPVTVGYVSDANVVDGCGCSFYWPGEENKEGAKSIFSSDFGEIVWMHLNGKDIQLKLIKSTESEKNVKKGGRYFQIYQAGDMTIRVDCHVTWTCEADMPDSESCEITHYDLKITFSQNTRQKIIYAKGVCGC